MIKLFGTKDFFENQEELFYVGFLKSPQAWFPLAVISDPGNKRELDALLLSKSSRMMNDMLQSYASLVQNIEGTFVQYLLPEEIRNLMERFGLESIAFLHEEDELTGLCDCGCGCG
jgi:hypothetical protein